SSESVLQRPSAPSARRLPAQSPLSPPPSLIPLRTSDAPPPGLFMTSTPPRFRTPPRNRASRPVAHRQVRPLREPLPNPCLSVFLRGLSICSLIPLLPLHILSMRKKRMLLLCAACALLAIPAFLALKPTPREPSYDGHPLSFWVEALAGATPIGFDTRTPR